MDDIVRAVARVNALPALAPGQTLDGTYELVERIGGGGMGGVFRARDLRLGRDVAVKVLRSEGHRDDHLKKLFEREARATAQLLHPNIVTLHHVGWGDGGEWDKAYDYFDRAWDAVLANLQKRFAEGPIDWKPFLQQLKGAKK